MYLMTGMADSLATHHYKGDGDKQKNDDAAHVVAKPHEPFSKQD